MSAPHEASAKREDKAANGNRRRFVVVGAVHEIAEVRMDGTIVSVITHSGDVHAHDAKTINAAVKAFDRAVADVIAAS
jgi:hypothetical protein